MLNKLRDEIHDNAVSHGWWEEERSFGDIIALCHSELSEALEEYRNKKPFAYCQCYVNGDCRETDETCIQCFKDDVSQGIEHLAKPEGIAVELADCIIRILDYCGKEKIDIEEVIKIKHEYNKNRPYRHGGKKI